MHRLARPLAEQKLMPDGNLSFSERLRLAASLCDRSVAVLSSSF